MKYYKKFEKYANKEVRNYFFFNEKKLGLFGSYGWGDGQWMRALENDMINNSVNLIIAPLIINETPTGESIDACRDFGRLAVK